MASTDLMKQKFSGIRNYWADVVGFLEARRAVETREKKLEKNLRNASDKMDQVFAKKREVLSHVNTNTSIEKLEDSLSNFELFMVNDVQEHVDKAEKLAQEVDRTLQKVDNSPKYHQKIVEGSEIINEELEEEITRSGRIINSSIEKLDRGAPPEEVADQVREFKVDTQKENFNKVQRNIDKIEKLLRQNSLTTLSGWKKMLSPTRSRKLRAERKNSFTSEKTGDLNTEF